MPQAEARSPRRLARDGLLQWHASPPITFVVGAVYPTDSNLD
jgi:hypothetical protein